jgi:hypothetical protein
VAAGGNRSKPGARGSRRARGRGAARRAPGRLACRIGERLAAVGGHRHGDTALSQAGRQAGPRLAGGAAGAEGAGAGPVARNVRGVGAGSRGGARGVGGSGAGQRRARNPRRGGGSACADDGRWPPRLRASAARGTPGERRPGVPARPANPRRHAGARPEANAASGARRGDRRGDGVETAMPEGYP